MYQYIFPYMLNVMKINQTRLCLSGYCNLFVIRFCLWFENLSVHKSWITNQKLKSNFQNDIKSQLGARDKSFQKISLQKHRWLGWIGIPFARLPFQLPLFFSIFGITLLYFLLHIYHFIFLFNHWSFIGQNPYLLQQITREKLCNIIDLNSYSYLMKSQTCRN